MVSLDRKQTEKGGLNRGLYPLYFITLLLLVLPLSSAIPDWSSFQKYYYRAGFQDPSYAGNFDDIDIYSKISSGETFQPLATDLDNDNVTDIIGYDGNTEYQAHDARLWKSYHRENSKSPYDVWLELTGGK